MDRVEIHTPRAESDDVAAYLALKAQALKSTLPVRRVTLGCLGILSVRRLKSTLPVRRVTLPIPQNRHKTEVEIHTPRAESDCEILSLSPHLLYI